MTGFEVIMNGRFWVIPEAQKGRFVTFETM